MDTRRDGDADTGQRADAVAEPAERLDSPAASPRSERPPYRSARTLAKVVTAFFILEVAVLIATAVVLLDSLDGAGAILSGRGITQEWAEQLARRANEVAIIALGLLAACWLVFCLWTYRVAKNAPALGRRPEISPGWAVGYYFIPILNLWKPYQALTQVWDASDPDPAADAGAPQSHGFMLFWWLVWSITPVFEKIASHWDSSTAESWRIQIQLSLIATALQATAAALAISVVWELTRRQDARAAALMPTARIV